MEQNCLLSSIFVQKCDVTRLWMKRNNDQHWTRKQSRKLETWLGFWYDLGLASKPSSIKC